MRVRNYIFLSLTVIIVILNIWWIINLILDWDVKNLENLKNIGLIQKQIWIENNITFWVLTINTIFIVILAFKCFYFNKPIYDNQEKN